MGYCFMTLEKIKNMNQMNGKYKHNLREIEVLNADPDKKHLNEELVSLNGKTYKEAFEERTKALGYGQDKKIRKNAVYGFEIVTTFSKDDAQKMDLEAWKKNNVEWLRKSFNARPDLYGDNVLSVVYHADEPGNVHCHAFVIPIDDKGNLNSRYYVYSRQKMIELQNSYAEVMKKEHNLKRGLKGSKATHQNIKKYYASLNQAIENSLPSPTKGETPEEYYKKANEIYKTLSVQNLALVNQNKRLKIELDTIEKNMAAEMKRDFFDKYQDEFDRLRDIEREYGSLPEIKEKCENYDSLIQGIADIKDNDDIVDAFTSLIENGRVIREKEKQQKSQKEER